MGRQLHGDLQIIASGGKLYSFLRNNMVSPCKSRPRKRCGIFSIATGFALAFLRDFCWLLGFCSTVRISS